MFSESSPCLLVQHSSFVTAQKPVELLEKNLQNLFHSLTPQTEICNGILLHPCQRHNGNYAPRMTHYAAKGLHYASLNLRTMAARGQHNAAQGRHNVS